MKFNLFKGIGTSNLEKTSSIPVIKKKEKDGRPQMILVEPRAFSWATEIADHLKEGSMCLVDFHYVKPDDGKRIVDFLDGVIYAIGGKGLEVGNGLFLFTPEGVDVQGKIEAAPIKKSSSKYDDLDF